MTTIVIRKDNQNSYQGFTCMGHAGYAKRRLFHREPDILCAAVSALTISLMNALQELADEKLKVTQNEETGFINCVFDGKLQEKSVFLMDSYVFSMKNLSSQYGEKYLTVKIEEV